MSRTMKIRDRAWLAGIVDGEGTITLCPNSNGIGIGYISISIGMTHVATIRHIRSLTGHGMFVMSVPKNPKHRTCYYWTVRCKQAAAVLRKLLPFLVTKKKQALLALQFDALMMPIGKRIPARNRQQRHTLAIRWKLLNQKGRRSL
jgi:hypothetical protein